MVPLARDVVVPPVGSGSGVGTVAIDGVDASDVGTSGGTVMFPGFVVAAVTGDSVTFSVAFVVVIPSSVNKSMDVKSTAVVSSIVTLTCEFTSTPERMVASRSKHSLPRNSMVGFCRLIIMRNTENIVKGILCDFFILTLEQINCLK